MPGETTWTVVVTFDTSAGISPNPKTYSGLTQAPEEIGTPPYKLVLTKTGDPTAHIPWGKIATYTVQTVTG